MMPCLASAMNSRPSFVEFQAFRPAVILGRNREFARFRHPKDPSVRNIDTPEIAFAIEDRPFEQRGMMGSRRLGLDPIVPVIRVVPLLRISREDARLDQFRGIEKHNQALLTDHGWLAG